MSSETFKPGNRVVWWKQTPGGDYVFPVLSTVLAVTAKRIKIESEDEEGKVIRHVLPRASSTTPRLASEVGSEAVPEVQGRPSEAAGKEARRRSFQAFGAIGRPMGSSSQSREG